MERRLPQKKVWPDCTAVLYAMQVQFCESIDLALIHHSIKLASETEGLLSVSNFHPPFQNNLNLVGLDLVH